MAPPPPSDLPLQERVMRLAQTLQFGWFIGHLLLLISTLQYTWATVRFNTATKLAGFSYRLAFVSAVATYGIVVYKAYRSKGRDAAKRGAQGASALGQQMVLDENVQYLFIALIWLFSRKIYFALLPFTVYSIFHFLSYLRANILPTLFPVAVNPTPASPSPTSSTTPKSAGSAGAVSETIGKFVKSYYEPSMLVVSFLELLLLGRLFLGIFTFKLNALILFLSYAGFVRQRYTQSNFTRKAIKDLEIKIDQLMGHPSVPEQARGGWAQAKGLAGKYSGATGPVPGAPKPAGAAKTQ